MRVHASSRYIIDLMFTCSWLLRTWQAAAVDALVTQRTCEWMVIQLMWDETTFRLIPTGDKNERGTDVSILACHGRVLWHEVLRFYCRGRRGVVHDRIAKQCGRRFVRVPGGWSACRSSSCLEAFPIEIFVKFVFKFVFVGVCRSVELRRRWATLWFPSSAVSQEGADAVTQDDLLLPVAALESTAASAMLPAFRELLPESLWKILAGDVSAAIAPRISVCFGCDHAASNLRLLAYFASIAPESVLHLPGLCKQHSSGLCLASLAKQHKLASPTWCIGKLFRNDKFFIHFLTGVRKSLLGNVDLIQTSQERTLLAPA
jgi:hypothetical protein